MVLACPHPAGTCPPGLENPKHIYWGTYVNYRPIFREKSPKLPQRACCSNTLMCGLGPFLELFCLSQTRPSKLSRYDARNVPV